MTANKETYRMLFNDSCLGMDMDNHGLSPRYELVLIEPSRQRWNDIKALTNADNRQMESFFSGAKGGYYQETRLWSRRLTMADLLVGECLTLTFSGPGNNGAVRLGLLKLSDCKLLVTAAGYSGQPGDNIGYMVGDTIACSPEAAMSEVFQGNTILNIHFNLPSIFHRAMDKALLRHYRRRKVCNFITDVYCQCAEMVQGRSSRDDVETLLAMLSERGIGTYTARVIFDTLVQTGRAPSLPSST